MHLERVAAELVQVRRPGGPVDKAFVDVASERGQPGLGQMVLAPAGAAGVVDEVGRGGTRWVVPALSSSRTFKRLLQPVVAKAVNCSLPICVQSPFLALCRAPVSPTVIHGAVARPVRSSPRASPRKASCPALSSRTNCRLELLIPRSCQCPSRRGMVVWP